MNTASKKKKTATNPFHDIRRREFKRTAECERGATLDDVPKAYFTPSLQEICAARIADTFDEQLGVDSLDPELRKLVIGQLSTDLKLERAVQRVKSESYWKACCLDTWSLGRLTDLTPTKKLQPPEKGGWKRLYLERVLAESLMSVDPATFLSPEQAEALAAQQSGAMQNPDAAAAAADPNAHLTQQVSITNPLPTSLSTSNGVASPNSSAPKSDGSQVGADFGRVQRTEEQTESAITNLCTMCGPDVYSLNLSHLMYHLDVPELLTKLPHLEELSVTYGTLNANVNFRMDMIGMKQNDAIFYQKALRSFPTLTSLSLPGNSIDSELLRCISAGLVKNSTLVKLDLSHNRISDLGVQALATVLMKKDSSIRELDLSDNRIGRDGAKFLGQALTANSTLASFSLRLNRLTDDGGKLLFDGLCRNGGVQSLNVSNNQLGGESARSLDEALRVNMTLRTLDIAGNDFQEEGGRLLAAAVKGSSSLCEVDARESGIADVDVQAMKEVTTKRVTQQRMDGIDQVEARMRDGIAKQVAEKVRKTHGI